MTKISLVITSIANDSHPVLNLYAVEAANHKISYIVVGDTKSPKEFRIKGCSFYSIEDQESIGFKLVKNLPKKHYSRKNIGYLVAIKGGAEIIIETDDDNIPFPAFWEGRSRIHHLRSIKNAGWFNAYKHFSDLHIWPRGFDLEKIHNPLPELGKAEKILCPIQQGLADDNPDVDAIYRLTLPLPFTFGDSDSIALGDKTICPFNSQNTTWFKEAFPLLYLPSYCSFRMTDIWRSFIAQRIAWTCGWSIMFHRSTVRQNRNDHNLINDFEDEISGYLKNPQIVSTLMNLSLKDGVENIFENLFLCYQALIRLGVIDKKELQLVKDWIIDLSEGF